MSKPIQWCPFSESVSPLSPDPQPTQHNQTFKTQTRNNHNNDACVNNNSEITNVKE